MNKSVKKEFTSDNPKTVLYNLPKNVTYCKSCLMSNQRPDTIAEHYNKKDQNKQTIQFSEDNICYACKWAKKKDQVDWEKREFELRELCNKYRSRNGSYDCIVPGSGGKDSFYTAHKLKYDYKMNPLTIT